MKENTKFNLSTLLFVVLVGTFIGSLAASRSGNIDIFSHYLVNGGFLADNHNFFSGFTNALYSSALTLIVLMFCGFCAISQPIIFLTLLSRGFSLGAGIATTYLKYDTRGVFLTVTLILPFALMSSAVIVLAARESFSLSKIFADFAFKSTQQKLEIKLYFIKFAVLFVLMLIAVIIQGCLCIVVK